MKHTTARICFMSLGLGLSLGFGCTSPGKTDTNSDSPVDTPTPISQQPPNQIPSPPERRTYKHSAKITSKYDKFKDITSVNLAYSTPFKIANDHWLSLGALFNHFGRTETVPGFFTELLLASKSKDWEFTKYRSLTVLADGERLSLGEMNPVRSNVFDDGYVQEVLSITISLVEFRKITNAKKVEMQLGNVEFIVSEDILEGLRDLASRMFVNR